MECNSNEVQLEEHDSKRSKVGITSCQPFLRQLFVCSGVWSIYFVLGLCYGAPTVFIPQIRREANSTEVISDDMASWLSSVHGYSAIPWIITLPTLIKVVGRRIPFLIVCVSTILAFSLFYTSTSPTMLLISEVMQGILISSNMILLIVVVTEYTSPQYRGIFMTIKSTIFFWGVWIANATGTFGHWRYIAIIAFVCSGYAVLSALVWPDSPSWLAMKGRFKDCATAHRWLKGVNQNSEKELDNLIISQKQYLQRHALIQKTTLKQKYENSVNTLRTRAFYMPLLLSMMTMSLYNFTGKFVCTMYSIDLIKKITNSESTAYMGMLIIEALTIFSMQIGCIFSKYLRRRTMLLGSSSVGIAFLFIISLYLYCIKLNFLSENKTVSILLLTLFSMTVSCGPMIMACSVYGELTPLRYKSCSLPLLAIFSELLMGSLLKVSPYIFKLLDIHGAFLFYALSASVFVCLLYKLLPESKDKTLLEIEEYFSQTTKLNDDSTLLKK